MARPILQLEASNEEVAELGRLVRGSKVSVRDRFRANIILRRLEGKSETGSQRAWLQSGSGLQMVKAL